MVPRKWATPKTLDERTNLVANRECTNSHFPHKISVHRRQPAVSYCDSIYTDDGCNSSHIMIYSYFAIYSLTNSPLA